jgi:hypothetical protein
MSSILDALRKVEAEKTKQKVDLGEVEEMLAEKELLVPEEQEEERSERRVNRAAIVLASVAVIALFGAGGFFLYGKLTGGGQAEVADDLTGAPVPARLPGQPVLEEPSEPSTPPPASVAESPPPAPVAAEPESAVEEPLITQESGPESPEAADARDAGTAAAEPAAAARPTLKINILRPSSGQFPEALAVVNRQQVGVGESVDGAKVLEIRSGGILFEYAGESFFVQF